MGLKDRRARRAMVDPVRGEFRVSTWYDPHPGRTPPRTMLTGVVVADGLPPTPLELPDHRSLGVAHSVLPVLVDRAEPTRALVLWDEVAPVDYRADARRQAAADAARLGTGGPAAPSTAQTAAPRQVGPDVTVTGLDELPPWLRQAVGAALDGDEPGRVTVQYGSTPGSASAPASGGRPARAVLTAVTDVPGVPAYALPSATASLCDLALQVSRPDGSSYPAQTRMGFRTAERRSRLAVVGSAVPVLVDPADEAIVAVDIPAWDAATR